MSRILHDPMHLHLYYASSHAGFALSTLLRFRVRSLRLRNEDLDADLREVGHKTEAEEWNLQFRVMET